MQTPPPEVIGWREWVGLPDLGVAWVKAKVDTGARSSSLHAVDLEFFDHDDDPWVRFTTQPWQRSADDVITATAPLVDERAVKSSNGHIQNRPVIRTLVRLGDSSHPVDLTLTDREEMGFRLLLGREAVRNRSLVNPGRSYLIGRPDKKILRKNRGKA